MEGKESREDGEGGEMMTPSTIGEEMTTVTTSGSVCPTQQYTFSWGGRKRWLQEGSGWQLWEEYGQDSGSLGKEEGDGSVGETRQQQMTTNMDSRLNNQTNKVEGEG